MENGSDDPTPLGKFLGIIGFVAGFSVGWQHSDKNFVVALVLGLIVGAMGAFLGKLVWQALAVLLSLMLSIGTCYVRQELVRGIVRSSREPVPFEAPEIPDVPNVRKAPGVMEVPTPTKEVENRDNIGMALYLENTCAMAVDVAVLYKAVNNEWHIDGWWSIAGKKRTRLNASNKQALISSSSELYYYAEIPKTDYTWEGALEKEFRGRDLLMREVDLSVDGAGYYVLSIDCNSYVAKKSSRPRVSGQDYLLGINGADLKSFLFNGKNYHYGVKVNSLLEGMPAKRAGLLPGDILYSVDGKNISTMAFLRDHVNRHKGKGVSISFLRKDRLQAIEIASALSPTVESVVNNSPVIGSDSIAPEPELGAGEKQKAIMVCLISMSSSPVRFRVRWDDSEWKAYKTLEPNQRWWFSHKRHKATPPELKVEFAAGDLSDVRTESLKGSVSDLPASCERSQKYYFSAPQGERIILTSWSQGWSHPFIDNLITGRGEGKWRPEPGYVWLDDEPRGLSVIKEGFGAIGIDIRLHEDTKLVQIVHVLPHSEAEAAGLPQGYLILKIDGFSAYGLRASEVASKIKGPAGTTVKLLVADPLKLDNQRIFELRRASLSTVGGQEERGQ